MAAQIRCGTCAWSDHEEFYPPGLKPGERLGYYARFFPLVEVDSTFYALQPQRNFASWVQKTPPGFVFNVKAYGAMTRHHRQPRPGEENLAEVFRKFAYSIIPLREAGKLRAVHFQFPPWFVKNRENMQYLAYCREAFPDDLVAIEFRHRSWLEPAAAAETLEWLRELRAVHVVCDEPQIGTGSVPMVLATTHPALAVVRFHGRNTATWYKKAESSTERFDYLYSREELQAMVPDLLSLANKVEEIHLLMNNNRSNYAVRNTLDLMELLGLPVPPRDHRGVPAQAESGPNQLRFF